MGIHAVFDVGLGSLNAAAMRPWPGSRSAYRVGCLLPAAFKCTGGEQEWNIVFGGQISNSGHPGYPFCFVVFHMNGVSNKGEGGGVGGRGIIAPPLPLRMRKVLLDLGGVSVEGVVERDFVLLPVAAVLAAGGSLRAVPPGAADPEPDPPAARVPPPPPAPRRARPAAAARLVLRPVAKPAARPQAKADPKPKRKRGGKRWNRPQKKNRRN